MYERDVIERMTERGLKLATAESTVGGLIGHLLTNVPGSSKVFVGGITAYGRAPKLSLLRVNPETPKQYGAESEETVREMVRGAREAFEVDIAVAESGYADRTDDPDRAGGLYYIGIAAEGYERVQRYIFDGDREATKQQAADETLRLVLEYLEESEG